MKRLNLGCGLRLIPGFDNIDGSPNVLLSRIPLVKPLLFKMGLLHTAHMAAFPREILWMRLPNGLARYSDGSADRVYTSHFLEHLHEEAAMKTLREVHRILCPGGIFRLVLPDTAIYARQYLAKVEELTSAGISATEPRDRLATHIAGGYRRAGSGHLMPWDIPSAEAALYSVGFKVVKRAAFGQGADPVLAAADNRPDDSLFLEATKS